MGSFRYYQRGFDRGCFEPVEQALPGSSNASGLVPGAFFCLEDPVAQSQGETESPRIPFILSNHAGRGEVDLVFDEEGESGRQDVVVPRGFALVLGQAE